MPKRIDMGTDSATVGVWDPGIDVLEQPGDYRDFIESEARAGRLFFIDTLADGGYRVAIYVDEQPDDDNLAFYVTPDRTFLIESSSGRLVAGGLEDFGNPSPQVTTKADTFKVTIGRYALRFYQRDDERFDAHIREEVGEADLDYYTSRFKGCTHGCLLFVAALITGAISYALADLYPWLWFVPAALVVISFVYGTVSMRAIGKDQRYQDIHKRVGAIERRFPPLIFVLTPLADGEQVEGGWHELT